MRNSDPFKKWAETVVLPNGQKLVDSRANSAAIFSFLSALSEAEQDDLFSKALELKADLRKFAAMVAMKNLNPNPIFALIRQLEESVVQQGPKSDVPLVPTPPIREDLLKSLAQNDSPTAPPIVNRPDYNEDKVEKPLQPGAVGKSEGDSSETEGNGEPDEVEKPLVPAPPSAPRRPIKPAAALQPAQQFTEPPSFSDWIRHPLESFKKWQKSREQTNSGGGNTGKTSQLVNINNNTVRSVVLIIVLAAVAIPLFVLIFKNATKDTSYTYANTGDAQNSAPTEEPPVLPNSVPLNTTGSVQKQGFLGNVQLLVVTTSLLIVFALIGDRWYNNQNGDAVYTLAVTALTILFSFPQGLVWTIGAIVFLLLMFAIIWIVSTQGEGADFTNLAAWLLGVGGVGGLVVSKISTITNIFPNLQFTHIIPIVDLTYYLQTLNIKEVYPSVVVYFFVFAGTGVAIFELVRKSEDKTSPVGPIISVVFGILGYALFLHVFNLDAWISVLIGALVSIGVSAGSISPAGRQLVPREWGNKSPFDGAMLFLGILLSCVLVFGAAPWLIG